jgi:hypothetical protein
VKMLGKTRNTNVGCACCIAPSWKKTLKRAAKRRERQQWKKEIQDV